MPTANAASKPPGLFARHPRLRYPLYALLLIGAAWACYSLGRQAWASFQHKAALEAGARHDYVQAGIHIEKYIVVRPWDWEGWLLAAQTARQQGNFDHAARYLRQAKKEGAPDIALNLEGKLLVVQSGNLQAADELLTFCGANTKHNEVPLILEAVAEGALRKDDVARIRTAADLWLKIAASASDQAQGHLWIGQADKLDSDPGSTVAHFQQAYDLAPDHPYARIFLVAMLVHDQPERARPHLEEMRRQRPDDPDILFQTARMHRSLGETEQAAALLDQVLQSSAGSVPVILERANAALDLKRPQEAEPLLKKAVALAPTNRLVNVSMADCLRQLGNPDHAKVFDARAVEIEKKLRQGPGAKEKKS